MAEISRHQICALMLSALRDRGLGIRDHFEGRQEPLSWFFRVMAYDQSELDILESGALDALHAPSAIVELVVDEMAFGLRNIGTESLKSYLVRPDDAPGDVTAGSSGDVTATAPDDEADEQPVRPEIAFDDSVMLGFVHVDAAPPPLWLEGRELTPAHSDALALKLSKIAEELEEMGTISDTVEVHMEGAVDPRGFGGPRGVRPHGVAIHFTFDIPLVGTDKREFANTFGRVADAARFAVEGVRRVFRGNR